MYSDQSTELEDRLREDLMELITNPEERAKVFTLIKKYNHNTISAVLNDFQLTLEAKRNSIIQNFPIE